MKLVYVLEILGVISFALAGSVSGIRKRLDIFGVLIIAFVSSVGGGTIRDMMIGDTPVAWTRDLDMVGAIFGGFVLTLFFYRYVIYLKHSLFWLDTIGLALFCSAAIEKGISFHLSWPICIALGTITGTFGGVIRDVLLNEIPYIFRKDIYASACIAGGSVYMILYYGFNAPHTAEWLCITTIILIRTGAYYWDWRLPLIYKRSDG